MPKYCMLPTRHVKLRANGCPDRWYASVLLSDASSATAYAASAVCRLIVYVWSSCRKIQHQPVACPGQCLLQPTVHWEASSSCPCPQDSGNPKAVQPALRHGWSRSSQHAIPPVTTKASALGSCTHWPSVANRLPTTSHMRPIPQPPAGAILHGRRAIHLHTPSDRCTSARRAASPRNRCIRIQWDFYTPKARLRGWLGRKGALWAALDAYTWPTPVVIAPTHPAPRSAGNPISVSRWGVFARHRSPGFSDARRHEPIDELNAAPSRSPRWLQPGCSPARTCGALRRRGFVDVRSPLRTRPTQEGNAHSTVRCRSAQEPQPAPPRSIRLQTRPEARGLRTAVRPPRDTDVPRPASNPCGRRTPVSWPQLPPPARPWRQQMHMHCASTTTGVSGGAPGWTGQQEPGGRAHARLVASYASPCNPRRCPRAPHGFATADPAHPLRRLWEMGCVSLAPPRDPNHRCPALLAGVLRPKAGSLSVCLRFSKRQRGTRAVALPWRRRPRTRCDSCASTSCRSLKRQRLAAALSPLFMVNGMRDDASGG